MFYWLYDLPNWLVFVLFTVAAVAIGWMFIFALRRVNARLFGEDREERNGLVELVLTGTGLFYGLLLGLIAAATYTTYSDTENSVNSEATSVSALYRDVSNYPEPTRAQLRKDIEDYVRYVIDEAWPEQQKGEVPLGGRDRVTVLQNHLVAFEPVTEGDKILHAEALSQFNSFLVLRQQRINAVTTSLPAALWWVLILGALINLALISMLAVRKLAAHLVISGLFAVFVAMMIFLIVSMDNPFRGEFSVQPDAFVKLQTRLFGT
ncbi:hypothetical protein Lesp02_09540 [Lentzea sp. NBRC 105346]|uniref:bestrophin-like domain n=1 Tax=Lentzea sp. NBRC 105346 TaxID=3032205 RepID=UPI0024A177B1|nr:DUF4239 domain-containing protein [Lentzea sp. NBRC 105346]GLZ28764.1 hypothetical protein Lesp02_09540 [Lentzea sp. NBRC 105346]